MQKASRKRAREVPTKYKYEPAVGNLPNPHSREAAAQDEPEKYDYVVVSWGHAAGGKTGLDHEIDRNSGVGHPVYKSRFLGAVKVAAGLHHSLVLDDRGILHGFGESEAWQLGIRREGSFVKPRQVHPTGLLKNGVDFVLAEMAGGSTFSVARELNSSEQVRRTEMLSIAAETVKRLIAEDPDNQVLLQAWAYIRHELSMASRATGGTVLSWGTGAKGQLGHGDECKVEAPRPIRSLVNRQIRAVVTGYEHVLAIGQRGELYSWGKGKYGRLGHGDSDDRNVPTQVFAFDNRFVCLAAAGAAHTVVVVTDSPQVDDGNGYQGAAIYCFGRGAHGRIGKPDLRHSLLPHLLEVPPSLTSSRIKSIACGAAHNVLLAVSVITKSLARPWGVLTTMYSWGYGTNGQLGNGQTSHSHLPVVAKLPRSEIVVEITAGRSHSLCRTKLGDVYGWGKGWRGQVGLANKRIAIVPRKVQLPGACIMIASKYQHNIAICEYGGRSKASLEGHPAFEEIVSRLPEQIPSWSLPKLGCVRRLLDHATYSCLTCQAVAICNGCRLLCHKGHRCLRRAERTTSSPLEKLGCQCGPTQQCRVLPTVSDCFREASDEQFSLRAQQAAVILQKYARRMVARHERKRLLEQLATVRSVAAKRFYQQRVLDIVFHKVDRRKQQVLQVIERQRMQNEEKLWRLIIYYKRLQHALQALDLTKKMLSIFANSSCIRLPPKKEGLPEEQTPFLSWWEVRVDQLRRPARERLSPEMQLYLTIEYPIHLSSRARITTDPDLQSLFEHYHTPTHIDRQIIDDEDVSIQPRRRYSIADPNRGYRRMTRFETQMRVGLYKQRRNSLPDLRQLRDRVPVQKFTHRAALSEAQAVAQRRELVMLELLDSRYARSMMLLNEKSRRARFRRVLQFAWMNPRPEIQLRSRMLQPGRRATIAEPERIGIVQDAYVRRRELFASLRSEGAKKHIRVRRRSFDYGENRDSEQGLFSADAFTRQAYPDRDSPPTLADLLAMGRKMQQQYTRLTVELHKAAERDAPSRSRAPSVSTDRDGSLASSRYRAYSTRSSHSGDESARSATSDVPATRRTSHRSARHTSRTAMQSARSGAGGEESVREGHVDHHMTTGRSTSRLTTSRTNDMYSSHRSARTPQATGRSVSGSVVDSAHASARSSQGGRETHRSQRSVIANTDLVIIEDRYGREWVEMVDDAGNKYFFDPETNEARWEIALPVEGPYTSNRSELSSR